MASKLRDGLGKNVEPRTLEAFFWYVIAQRADQRSVNSRLDLLVLRNVPLSSVEEMDGSENAISSDSEQNYSNYSPSEDESSTDSEEAMTVDGDAVWEQPLEKQESGSTETGDAPAPRSRAGYASSVAPKAEQWYLAFVLCERQRGCLVPTASAEAVDERWDQLNSITPVPEGGECHRADRSGVLPAAAAEPVEQRVTDSVDRAVPVEEPNASIVSNEAYLLSTAVVEHRIEDSEVFIENDNSDGDDGGRANSFAPPASICDEINDGDCLERSSSATLSCPYNGHHSDADSPAAAEDVLSLMGRADREVQCDLYLTCWRDLLMTEMILQAEAVRRLKAFRDRLVALRDT